MRLGHLQWALFWIALLQWHEGGLWLAWIFTLFMHESED